MRVRQPPLQASVFLVPPPLYARLLLEIYPDKPQAANFLKSICESDSLSACVTCGIIARETACGMEMCRATLSDLHRLGFLRCKYPSTDPDSIIYELTKTFHIRAKPQQRPTVYEVPNGK